MKLPEIDKPLYEVQLLSIPKPVKYRAFTTREEKIMRMANESGDAESIINALKQIINNCVVDDIDSENLAIVDMETLFLHMRAKSIGEIGSQYYKCTNEVETETGKKPCNMVLEIPVNFLEIPIINKDVKKDILLSEDLGVKMKYPSLAMVRMLTKIDTEDAEIATAAACIELIYNKSEVFKASDCTQDELMEFIFRLPVDKYEIIKEFILNVPKTQLKTGTKCGRCGYDHKFTLEGLQDFFV